MDPDLFGAISLVVGFCLSVAGVMLISNLSHRPGSRILGAAALLIGLALSTFSNLLLFTPGPDEDVYPWTGEARIDKPSAPASGHPSPAPRAPALAAQK
jgi:hypothetical protein